MLWTLHIHGRPVFTGTRDQVLDVAEERGLVRFDTLGAQTGDPVWMPRITDRAAQIIPASRREVRRAA